MNWRFLSCCALMLLAVLSLSLTGCNKSDTKATLPLLDVSYGGAGLSASMLNFEQGASSVKIKVSSNAKWRVYSSAAWITITPDAGNGNGEFELAVTATELSRSAVVTVSLVDYEQVRCSFDVVQRVDNPELEPNPEPGDETQPDEPTPDDPEPDTPTDPAPDPGTETEPDPEDDEPNHAEAEQSFDYALIYQLKNLKEGYYHIGGYRNGQLHLATGGLTSVNHCNTSIFNHKDAFTSLEITDVEPAVVVLEPAAVDNGYYIRFEEDGYLTATSAGAGKLIFSDERSEYWLFSEHEDGGFVLRQSGDADVKLVISQNAPSDVLRSIAGDEDAVAVILLWINSLNQ
ncbi:MAG: hypothetical protein IKY82_08045 [Alistipes sp.]|nr:hypothetical protein [Alistipes sp.]